jgi:hypothetical protein
MSGNLKKALSAVDWNNNISEFCKSDKRVSRLTSCCYKISLFTHEVSFQDYDNPAVPFLQEMKASAFQAPACLALGLVKPAAGLMRASVESALYYSFFRNHPQELKTLLSKPVYYLTRKKIVDYHLLHTERFGKLDQSFNFVRKLDGWYGEISALVHGQIPGVWTSKSLANTTPILKDAESPIKLFERAAEIIQLLFLMTISPADWEGISPLSRAKLLGGLTQPQLEALGLPKV